MNLTKNNKTFSAFAFQSNLYIILLIALALLIPNLARAQNLCRNVFRYPTPTSTIINPQTTADCVQIDSQRKLCKRLLNQESHTALFFIATLQENIPLYEAGAFFGETDAFLLFRSTLENNGKTQWILANREGVGNGLAPQIWTITIMEDLSSNAPSVSYISEDFGESPFTSVSRKGSDCQLLITEWVQHVDSAGIKARYLLGRWFNYKQGQLIPALNNPSRARRLLFSFQKEYLKQRKNYEGSPAYWLRSEKTIVVLNEAKFLGLQTSRSFELSTLPEEANQLEILIRKTAAIPENQAIRLGDADSGRLFPAAYSLSQGKKMLRNTDIKVSRYDEISSVVWIHPNYDMHSSINNKTLQK